MRQRPEEKKEYISLKKKKEVADKYSERCCFQGEVQLTVLPPVGTGAEAGCWQAVRDSKD